MRPNECVFFLFCLFIVCVHVHELSPPKRDKPHGLEPFRLDQQQQRPGFAVIQTEEQRVLS